MILKLFLGDKMIDTITIDEQLAAIQQDLNIIFWLLIAVLAYIIIKEFLYISNKHFKKTKQ